MRSIHAPLLILIVLVVAWPARAEREAADPAALVRSVREAEAWIDGVRGLRLKIQGGWTTPADEIERRKAKYKKQFPQAELTEEIFPDLRPQRSDTIEIAFDERRAYLRVDDVMGPGTFNLRTWDGQRAIAHEKYSAKQEHYALHTKPHDFLDLMLAYLPWPRQAPHTFWWTNPDTRVDESFLGPAGTYELVGREQFRGVDCHVVQTPLYWRRMYIGVADGRLYGQSNRVLPRDTKAAKAVCIELARENGKEVSGLPQYYEWVQALPIEEQRKLELEYFRRLEPHSIPQVLNWFADWKEVAPRAWMPMTMGYDHFDTDNGASEPLLAGSRALKVIEVGVNPTLPDELFAVQMNEGVQVNDWGHDPPLFYPYKRDRTEQEWQAIIAAANKQKAQGDQQRAARDKLIGQPAPAFPVNATWLQSEPLTWERLRGKVVVLDFFAEWCGPCRNDFPTLAALHKEKDSGIVVIGVHNPGSDVADIQKLLQEFEMAYPICIDIARPGAPPTWGTLSETYGVWGIPYAFVIDRDGNVAGHGSLGKVLMTARQLAAQE